MSGAKKLIAAVQANLEQKSKEFWNELF
ncbi:hypothetical protein [Priestia megaterium]